MSHTIFHVAGGAARIWTTATEARNDPNATVFISSDTDPSNVALVLAVYKVERARVVFDFTGYDTVTQVVWTKSTILAMGTTLLTIVTERRHMRRVKWIARITYRFTKVRLRFVVSGGTMARDPVTRLLKDIVRAWLAREMNLLLHSATRADRERLLEPFQPPYQPPMWYL